MFCKNCGAEIDDNAVVCPKCGVAVNETPAPAPASSNDAPSIGFAILSFFIPLVGLILYIVWRTESPLKAKSCGKGAIIGFCVGIVLSVLSTVLLTCLVTSVADAASLLAIL